MIIIIQNINIIIYHQYVHTKHIIWRNVLDIIVINCEILPQIQMVRSDPVIQVLRQVPWVQGLLNGHLYLVNPEDEKIY